VSALQRSENALAGYALVAVAAFLWAASANLAKAAFAGGWIRGLQPVDVLTLTQMRSTVSFLLLFPALVLLRGWRSVALPWKAWLSCMLLGMIGVAGSNFFYYYAIQKTTVATAVVVQYIAPVYVMVIRLAMRDERLNRWRVAAVASAVAGCALVVGIGSGVNLHANALGILAAQGAALSFTIYNVGGGKLATRIDPLLLMVYAMMGAAILWLPINTPRAWVAHHYDVRQWSFLIVFAVISMLVPYTVYFIALRRLDATRAIIISCLEPVFAALLAWLLLREALLPLQVLGVGLVVAATLLTQVRGRRGRAEVLLPEIPPG
jgi:drug/metabolite transporter (DMT)-like permease